MQILPLALPEVKLIRPRVFGDERGFFMEAWNRRRFAEAGLPDDFVQLNHSSSARHTLRGMHLQFRQPQGKLVRVLAGRIFDVAVDARPASPEFGRWVGQTLDAADHEWLWIPPGFGHGFCVLSEQAEFEYLCTAYYDPNYEGSFLWNDPAVAIHWPITAPLLSPKDSQAPSLASLIPRLRA
ncbi:MAG: dTDP-4-dehydrorhamnose 3,5-epimerase [Calditrichaeota bacterium]|nr:dTDP-4-dehydrorhamnose 3,5-epimerase [Calditrichota bacterium]